MIIQQSEEFREIDRQIHRAILELRYDDAAALKVKRQQICPHQNQRVVREGMTKTIGHVVCDDCGWSREWDAY
jgi:hypothetical protein